MKVAHICTVAPTASLLLLGKLRALRRAGHRVDVICSPGPELASVRDAGFRVSTVPIPRTIRPVADLAALARLARLLRAGAYDAVHTHTSKAGLLGRIAGRLARVPLVLHTYHGLSFAPSDPLGKRLAYELFERIGGAATDTAFSQGRSDLEWLARRKVLSPHRLRWIGNGIDLEALVRSAQPDGLTASPYPSGGANILFAGRLEPVKDPGLLLSAWNRVLSLAPDARLWMAGEGPLRARLMTEARALGGCVRFLGFREDLPRWMAHADLVVLPSRKEGLPRVLMEAMALGRPCVASDIPGNRELLRPSPRSAPAGILFPAGNAETLAHALQRILADPPLGRRMGIQGRRRIEASHRAVQVEQRLVACYEELERTLNASKRHRWPTREAVA